VIHVYPVDEQDRHDLTEYGAACLCRPDVDWSEAEAVVVHRSWNGRELIEQAEEIINGPGSFPDGNSPGVK